VGGGWDEITEGGGGDVRVRKEMRNRDVEYIRLGNRRRVLGLEIRGGGGLGGVF